MAYTEFSSDNNFYIKWWNLIVLFHFENRQVFLPHPVFVSLIINRLIVFEHEDIKMLEKYPKLFATLRHFIVPEAFKVQKIAFHHHCHIPE